MTTFDRYLVIDWSASSTPKTGADSIWIADLGADDELTTLANPPTRRLAETQLDDTLVATRGRGERVLVAVDVALGYPAGTVDHFHLDGDSVSGSWRAMWTCLEQSLSDDDRNRNDRFAVAARLNAAGHLGFVGHGVAAEPEGPFWGCPQSAENETLRRTKPRSFALPEFRATDRRLHEQGRRPFSVWQLLGVGSVGSQSLTAIPVLRRLVEKHRADVWPFTTGLRPPTVEPGSVVVAEVWPSGFPLNIPVHWIKDAGQVDGVARRLRDADRSNELANWWTPDVDSAGCASSIVDEEGWVLGVT